MMNIRHPSFLGHERASLDQRDVVQWARGQEEVQEEQEQAAVQEEEKVVEVGMQVVVLELQVASIFHIIRSTTDFV